MDSRRQIEILPEFNLPVTECANIGAAREQVIALSVTQSDAFRRYLDEARSLYPTIKIDTVAFGASSPLKRYPEELDGLTAGEWSEVALADNRVYFQLIPGKSSTQSWLH